MPKAASLAIILPDGAQLAGDAKAVEDGLTLVALALDASNQALAGVEVTFQADSGEVAVDSATTDGTGRATAVLTTARDASPRGITVTVKDANGRASGSTIVTVVPPSNNADPVARLGTLSADGSTFSQGVFNFQVSPLAAGGSSGFQIDVVDTANANSVILDPINFTFSSRCITAGTSVVNPAGATPNTGTSADGAVSGTYLARGCSGEDVVTARAVINGSVQTARGTISVQPASLASIRFVSAVPINIGLRGSGLQETSRVTFQVVNSAGGPIANQVVKFALNTTVGGVSLSPASGTTDSLGNVSTVVTSGTVSTVVRVTATAGEGSGSVSSQSEQLTITTGIPDQNSFSLSAECVNAEGLNIDNVQVPMLLLAADRYNNPVPDSTAVTFTTEGGSIIGSCNMQDGACTVNWRSQDPRPANGRSTVLAFAVGEESFVDADGDGLYDSGETFTNLPEAFLDANENGIREASEPFQDFNRNGVYDGDSPQNRKFNGLLCDNGSASNILCAEPRTVHVRDSLVITMSGSNPVINTLPGGGDVTVTGANSFADGVITIDANEVFTLRVVVRDVNNQPMPAATKVDFAASGDAGSTQGTTSFQVPCTNNDAALANTYGIAFKGADIDVGDPNGFSTLELTVTSPSGVATIYSFGVVTLAPTPPAP